MKNWQEESIMKRNPGSEDWHTHGAHGTPRREDAKPMPAWAVALRWFGNEVALFVLKLSLALGTLVAVLWLGLLLYRSAAGPDAASIANRVTAYERKITDRPAIDHARDDVESAGVDVRMTPQPGEGERKTAPERLDAFRRFVTSRGKGPVTTSRTPDRF